MMSLDKYLPKVQVIEKQGAKELVVVKKPDTPTDFLFVDTSKKNTIEQKPTGICEYEDRCPLQKEGYCYFDGKYCNWRRVIV
jgi:hypothetical protein